MKIDAEYSCEWLLTWKRNNHAGFGKSENEYSNIPSFEKGQTGFEIVRFIRMLCSHKTLHAM